MVISSSKDNSVTKESESPDLVSDDNVLLEQVTEDVRELERYVKEFSEFLPLPVLLITPVKNIVDVNKAFQKLLGYEQTEIIGQQLDFVFENKQDADRLFGYLKKYGEIGNLEMNIIAKNKDRISTSVAASHRLDSEGNIIGFFVALTDIRVLKKLQDSLEDKVRERTKELEKMQRILLDTLDEVRDAKDKIEEEKNKTAGIISNFPDPVFLVDAEWKLALLNPAAKEVFALDSHSIGQKIDVNDRFSFTCFKNLVKKVIYQVNDIEVDENNNLVVEEVVISPKHKTVVDENPFSVAFSGINQGSVVYKVLTASVYDEQNTCYGHMKIFFDLTREKLIDKMKSEFVSIAAHQLRTPLSAIKWSIKLVLDQEMGKLNEMQKRTLEKGYLSNERVIKLVNDMLDVSRIEEGRFGYSFKVAQIKVVLNEVLTSAEGLVKGKKIKLTTKIATSLPPIHMDKAKIILALQNILENSIAYTPERGKISIEVKKGKNCVVIAVKDNGVGIPKSDVKKLYTKFFRASNVVRMQTDGSGLGLFIAKNIINKHGGTIDFKSIEGEGTEFIICLPIKHAVTSDIRVGV